MSKYRAKSNNANKSYTIRQFSPGLNFFYFCCVHIIPVNSSKHVEIIVLNMIKFYSIKIFSFTLNLCLVINLFFEMCIPCSYIAITELPHANLFLKYFCLDNLSTEI